VRVAVGSLTVPFTVTGVKLVMLRFNGERIVTVICEVEPYVMLSVAVALFPAWSVATIVRGFFPVTRLTVHAKVPFEIVALAPLHVTLSRPETSSLAVPFTPIDDVAVAMVVPSTGDVTASFGGAVSRLIVVEAWAVFPAASCAVPAID
jgi:hypothetical protein